MTDQDTQKKIDAAVKAERDRCAKVADSYNTKESQHYWGDSIARGIADEIRNPKN